MTTLSRYIDAIVTMPLYGWREQTIVASNLFTLLINRFFTIWMTTITTFIPFS